MTIHHLVLSGGGVATFAFYGILRQSFNDGFWHYDNIKTIYGTSAGAIMMSFIPCIPHLSWEILDDFMLKRPWHKLFNFSVPTMLDSYKTKGLFTPKLTEDMVTPLFAAVDLTVNTTLQEYFEFSGIDLHYIAVDLVKMELVDISHTTHPDWRVCDAIYCSMCLPVLCAPYRHNDSVYVDGGIMCNFPAHLCVNNGAKEDEILGIDASSKLTNYYTIPEMNTMIDYLMWLVMRVWGKSWIPPTCNLKYHVRTCMIDGYISIYDIYKSTSNIAERTKLVDNGVNDWRIFYNNLENIHVSDSQILTQNPLEELAETSGLPVVEQEKCQSDDNIASEELPSDWVFADGKVSERGVDDGVDTTQLSPPNFVAEDLATSFTIVGDKQVCKTSGGDKS